MTTCLVTNCFHWVGYHIVTQLLENGYQVVGVASGNNAAEEHLSMFFGRNSDFELRNADDLSVYDTAITVGSCISHDKINARRQFHITRDANKQEKADATWVHVPLLFGEWMPMNEEGMYCGEEFIQFDSHYFQKQAVYVGDFIAALFEWLEINDLPKLLEVLINQADDMQMKCNQVYLSNDNIEEKLRQVLNHYQRFQHFYES